MMKVFVNLAPLALNLDIMTRNEVVLEVFNAVSEVYNDCCGISDAYLQSMEPHEIQCIFGRETPKTIVQEAEKWNDRLRTNVLAAMSDVVTLVEPIPLDTPATYELKKAAIALDNSFYAFADYATLLSNDHACLTAIVRDEHLQTIREHPENYAIIEVYPK